MRLMSAPSLLKFTNAWINVNEQSFKAAWTREWQGESCSSSYKEKKEKLGLKIDTHSFKSNLITYYKDGKEVTKRRSVVTLEYKGGPIGGGILGY